MIKLPTLFPQKAKPAKKTLPPLRYPHGPEQQYVMVLHTFAQRLTRALRDALIPALPKLLRRLDAADSARRADALGDFLRGLLAKVLAQFGIGQKVARSWALDMLSTVNVFHAQQFEQVYGQVLRINPLLGKEKWLAPQMSVALHENVNLITSIPEQLFSRVQTMVSDAVMGGKRVEQLAQELMHQFDVTENRAALIARDQVASWHGALQRNRQIDAGIREYMWSTSRDERVRRTHRQREGKTFNWDQPPSGGNHPGLEIMCRCVALPVLPDWEEG